MWILVVQIKERKKRCVHKKEVGGEKMTKRKKDHIRKALEFSPFSDMDGDGVQNVLDCNPHDPTRDGFFGDIGRAAKTRVKAEVGEIKERTIEGISGEEARERRKELQEAERESYLEEAKEQAEERGREKARAKYEKRKPLLSGFLGGADDEEIPALSEKVGLTLEKAGKHGKGILKETTISRTKTRMPDVKLPSARMGGITGKDVLKGTMRSIKLSKKEKPSKRGTKLKVGTKLPDAPMPDVKW